MLDLSSQPIIAKKDLNSQDEKKHYAATLLDDFCMFNREVGIMKK